MLDGNTIIFFKKPLNQKLLEEIKQLYEESSLLVEIEEFKEQENLIEKFLNNELKNVWPFKILLRKGSIIKNILIKALNVVNKRNKSNNSEFSSKSNIRIKSITDYLDPDIYNKSDNLSVDLFEIVKNTDFVRDNLFIDNVNMFETNRLEFVNEYYYNLLWFFAIKKIISIEKPSNIIVFSNLSPKISILIHVFAKKYKIFVKNYPKNIQSEKNFLYNQINKRNLIIERLWYWNLWKILNICSIGLKFYKNNLKRNLMLCHYKNFFPSLIEVLKKCKKSDKIQNILYVPHKLFAYSQEYLTKINIPDAKILPITDYNYSAYKRRYLLLQKAIDASVNNDELYNIKIEDLDFGKLVKLAFLTLYDKLLNSIRYMESLQVIFKNVNPHLITEFSGNDTFDVLCTYLAKQAKILTIFFPHALISRNREYLALKQDYVICTGQRDKDYYVELGTDPRIIKVLGLPRFDAVFRKIQSLTDEDRVRKAILQKLKFNPDLKTILLVTTHDEDYIRKKIYDSVVDLVSRSNDYQLIVKIHPIEDISFYKEELYKNKTDVVILKDVDLHEVIIASDLILGMSTGAQIEALLLNKKVINLLYQSNVGRYQMEQFGAVVPVFNPSDLEQAVAKVFYDSQTAKSLSKGREKYLKYTFHELKGNASALVFNFIKEQLYSQQN
jgi:hypothetical protein